MRTEHFVDDHCGSRDLLCRSEMATYHGKADGEGLRKRYYVDKRENFPRDHGTWVILFCLLLF